MQIRVGSLYMFGIYIVLVYTINTSRGKLVYSFDEK